MTVLYVMHEHPSVSQTFVVTEADALRTAGVHVVGYALKHGAAAKPAAEIDLICRPPSLRDLAQTLARQPLTVLAAFRQTRRNRLSRAEAPRALLAQLHTAYAL